MPSMDARTIRSVRLFERPDHRWTVEVDYTTGPKEATVHPSEIEARAHLIGVLEATIPAQ